MVGVESTPILITVPNYPLQELILTPYATSSDVVFLPPSITISRLNSTLTAAFTVTVTHPTASVIVNIALNGADAIYYSTGLGYPISIQKRMSTQTKCAMLLNLFYFFRNIYPPQFSKFGSRCPVPAHSRRTALSNSPTCHLLLLFTKHYCRSASTHILA